MSQRRPSRNQVLKRLASCLIAACSGRLWFRARLRPHAWPLAIDELCSGSFEGSPHGREILGRKHSSAFSTSRTAISVRLARASSRTTDQSSSPRGRTRFGRDSHLKIRKPCTL